MSACDISSFGSSHVSTVNRRRKELDITSYECFNVRQFVLHTPTQRVGRIHRFVESGGLMHVDLRLWMSDPSSVNRKLLKMFPAHELEFTEDPRPKTEEV